MADNIYLLLSKAQLQSASKLVVNELASVIFYNEGNLQFKKIPLPITVQFSSLNAVIAEDLNGDGRKDLLTAGNFFPYRVQLGRSASSVGAVFLGTGEQKFETVDPSASGFFASGDIRNMVALPGGGGTLFIIAKNDGPVQVFKKQ
ncbi:MAG: VCBS repeat-containing protein [Sphingobacteriales bacterium]|nr:MAG: VCBS repeat-containing protein [Sphingobacteriales bacterium]